MAQPTSRIDKSYPWPSPDLPEVARRIVEFRRRFVFKIEDGRPFSMVDEEVELRAGQCITCGEEVPPITFWENGLPKKKVPSWRCDPCRVAFAVVLTGYPDPYYHTPEHVPAEVTQARWDAEKAVEHERMVADVAATKAQREFERRMARLDGGHDEDGPRQGALAFDVPTTPLPEWPEDAAWNKSLQCRVDKRFGGKALMTGKVVVIPTPPAPGSARGPRALFVHEESGTQEHFNTSSPGGVDVGILSFLVRQRVGAMVHVDKNTGKCYYAPTAVILAEGERRVYGDKDGNPRDRVYLAYAHWQTFDQAWWGKTPYVTAIKVVDV